MIDSSSRHFKRSTNKIFFHESLFYPQMTPKKLKKRNFHMKIQENYFEKSSGLPASLDVSKQPKKQFFYSHGDLSTLLQTFFKSFTLEKVFASACGCSSWI